MCQLLLLPDKPGNTKYTPKHKLLPLRERPAGRVTLTPPALNSARNLVFLVTGRVKPHAIYQTLYGPRDLDKWPAQCIMPVAGKASSSISLEA